MKIVIAGGTGLIGQRLAARAEASDHNVVILSRNTTPVKSGSVVQWDADPSGDWIASLQAADAVVNLCGASIGEGRWTAARKTIILDSRRAPAHALTQAMNELSQTPVYVQASAVGYYGPGTTPVDEHVPPGNDYLADLAVEWEDQAKAYNGPTVIARFGVVLDRNAGALPMMALPFRLFVGGRLGNGSQWLSWIHADDAANALLFTISNRLEGPINITAPTPVTNAHFGAVLGKVLKRPSLLPTPSAALYLLLGEQATLLLTGQKAIPANLGARGFEFKYPEIEEALRNLFS